MIRNLNSGCDGDQQADVVVIGGGIAGLLIATRLVGQGKRVIVLEAGDEHQIEETHPYNEVEQTGTLYAGAEHGRFRCLGGTSTRWGGALIPMQRADLETYPSGSWPIAWDALMRHLPELERLFKLPTKPYDLPYLVKHEGCHTSWFLPRLAKWPPFRLRNVAALFDEEIRSLNGPEVWLNAVATRFAYSADGRVEAVTATGPAGVTMTVRAGEFVVAAGAIESTRLLLLADEDAGDRLFKPWDVLGRYFHDHLSTKVADINPFSRRQMNRLVGFRFERGGMRNLRFEPIDIDEVRRDLSPCFAHIGFAEDSGSAFSTVRELYRLIQQRRVPEPALLLRLILAGPWLTRAAWWRFFHKRLLFPAHARLELHMVIEQTPRASNRISLSPNRTDAFGRALSVIDWTVDDTDIARLTHSTDRFVEYWNDTSLGKLGSIQRYPSGVAESLLAKGGGIYHPGGSTRMGYSPSDGVVDKDFRCFSVPNLSVASTSVFPTGGGANPTMMLMLACVALADRLSKK